MKDSRKHRTPILDHTVLDHAEGFRPSETLAGKALEKILADHQK